ncbi:DUF858-domain-containing protein [Wolfiporia cocos MD-104 SS10]|uniref:Alpha N-terminal protein methyltransferase 1 n=1 Tax=Wolfiporia cocos (strain MD-104) TaxID=742152 RepID=A0A2H3JGV8_WOLCO|nr:DUF858-domain-containing protein [Wolfiporia cocos MD-104 SS10]
MPELCTVPSALRRLDAPASLPHRYRALDVGAGIGRVTADVLLHLVHDVVLVEPVESLVQEALARGKASADTQRRRKKSGPWKGIQEKAKSVTFIQDTLQGIDPIRPSSSSKVLGRVGYVPPAEDLDEPFDVVWGQWCLGSLSDPDLVKFLKRSRAALRDPSHSLIIVKENCCADTEDGKPQTVYDDTDSTLTRSDLAWKKLFEEAGLQLIQEQTQLGFPEGLYMVRMLVPRSSNCAHSLGTRDPSHSKYAEWLGSRFTLR